MKKFCLIVICLLQFVGLTHAQISTFQIPQSFSLPNLNLNSDNTLFIDAPNITALEKQDSDIPFKPQTCAYLISVEEDFFDKAKRIKTPSNDIYLLKIKAEGALALNLYSNNFYLPEGCELYLWNTDKTKCLGAFTSDNNSQDGYFATDYVYGEEMIIELDCPTTQRPFVRLMIEKIGYFYRDVINFEQEKLLNEDQDLPQKDYRGSESCNVNVNCSEGDNFRLVQRSVVRLLIPYSSYESAWCTGTLINNTNNDYTPYVLTAAHCIEGIQNMKYARQTVFYFNYETSSCKNSTKEPTYSSLTGCKVLAYGDKYGEGDSDYMLLQINNSIPKSINAYWAGWTRSTDNFSNCVGIHHPSGDVKKISTIDGKIQNIGYDEGVWDYDTHIMVLWKQTSNGYGVTEGGSSGSALFNSDQRIIGTLSGGESSCYAEDDHKVDWYGRFDVTFNELKSWLDPHGYNCTGLKGLDNTVSLNPLNNQPLSLTIYPNPATNNLSISLPNSLPNAVLTILDRLGRTLYSQKLSSLDTHLNIDVSNLTNGVYFVRIYHKGDYIIKKIIVEK